MHNELEIIKYLDGNLTSKERKHFKKHLNDCGECREVLMQHKKIKNDIHLYYDNIKFRKKIIQNSRHYLKYAFTIVVVVILLIIIFDNQLNEINEKNNSEILELILNKNEIDSNINKIKKDVDNIENDIKKSTL